jgi:hypothetical protein
MKFGAPAYAQLPLAYFNNFLLVSILLFFVMIQQFFGLTTPYGPGQLGRLQWPVL